MHAEIDTVLGDAAPTIALLKQLPYTLQVIKETLRLYPAAPMFARDAVAPDVIDGVPVPVGARMLLMPYLTHRHPDFWPDALRFDPDRWQPGPGSCAPPVCLLPVCGRAARVHRQ